MKTQPVIPYGQPLPEPDEVDGRDEMNLAEFPITLLSLQNPSGASTLEFVQRARDPETGAPVARTLTVDAGRAGLPTASDEEVLLVLIQATKLRNGFACEKVYFSPYELLKLLKWDTNARAYRRLRESLQRWVAVRLSYENAWYDNAAKAWVSRDFSVITQLDWYDGGRRAKAGTGQGAMPFSNFTWNPVVFQSFRDGYLKRLDYGFYIALRHPVARRVYRFLDKRFYRIPSWRFDLAEFAFQHVGLSAASGTSTAAAGGPGYTNVNKLKKKLEPGLAELEEKGFLAPLPPADRFPRLGRGRWEIVLARAASTPAVPPPDSPAEHPLAATLKARGVTAKTAAELAAALPAERIERQIDVLEWMQERPGGEPVLNPGAWLAAAIRDDYAAPAGYLPRAERERRQQASSDAAARRKQDAADKRRRELAEQAAERAKREHVAQVLVSMPADERSALEGRAVAGGDELQRRVIGRGEPGSSVLRQLLIEAEVLRVYPVA